MGITIDATIKVLENAKNGLYPWHPDKYYDVAIDTMRKYQKIVDIVSLNGEEFKQCGLKELKEILEVIADGNDK